MSPSETPTIIVMSSSVRTGRFLDGEFVLVLRRGYVPKTGYAVTLVDDRLWRNGDHVGYVERLSYDRDALGWWVDWQTWPGTPLWGRNVSSD